MSDSVRSVGTINVYPDDLDSGMRLLAVVDQLARTLGREPGGDSATAVAAADRLLIVLGLMPEPGPQPIPAGVEGVPIGGRH